MHRKKGTRPATKGKIVSPMHDCVAPGRGGSRAVLLDGEHLPSRFRTFFSGFGETKTASVLALMGELESGVSPWPSTRSA